MFVLGGLVNVCTSLASSRQLPPTSTVSAILRNAERTPVGTCWFWAAVPTNLMSGFPGVLTMRPTAGSSLLRYYGYMGGLQIGLGGGLLAALVLVRRPRANSEAAPRRDQR